METNINDFTPEQMPQVEIPQWQKELLGIANVESADHNWFEDRVDDLKYGRQEAKAMRAQIAKSVKEDAGDTAAASGVAGQYAKELKLAGIDPRTVNANNITDIAEKMRSYSGEDWPAVQVAAQKLDDAANRRQSTW